MSWCSRNYLKIPKIVGFKKKARTHGAQTLHTEHVPNVGALHQTSCLNICFCKNDAKTQISNTFFLDSILYGLNLCTVL
ncbi:hypothetical protein QL285_026577 [Trifolium repens]|nr:hypothetical protein QL285_026577 [Trifolium repens]